MGDTARISEAKMREALVTVEKAQAAARIAELEAVILHVKGKITEYVDSNFDPGMMAPTLDDIRHYLSDK